MELLGAEQAWRDWHDDGEGLPCPEPTICRDAFVAGANWQRAYGAEHKARLHELEHAVVERAKAETYAERISQLDLLPKLQVRRHEAVDALEAAEREHA